MPTIKFTAPAGVIDFKQIDPEWGDFGLFVEDELSLQALHGLSYTEESFSEYLSDGDETRMLAHIGVQGGYLSFAYDPRTKQLLASTEYELPRALTSEEVQRLKKYTVGQWSDGIGSNFFQERIREGLAPQVFVTDDRQVQVEQG